MKARAASTHPLGHLRRPVAACVKGGPIPSLTSLKVSVGEGALDALPEILLSHASSLVHMKVNTHYVLPTLSTPAIAHFLTGTRTLSLLNFADLDAMSSVLSQLTRLKSRTFIALSLSLPQLRCLTIESPRYRHSLSLLPPLLPLAAQITSMEVIAGDYSSEETRYLTQNFTSLTKLRLRPNGLSQALPHWRLPHLRELQGDEAPLAWLTTALRAFPTLARLTVSEVSTTPATPRRVTQVVPVDTNDGQGCVAS